MGRRKKISNSGLIFYLILGWALLNVFAGVLAFIGAVFAVPFVIVGWVATYFPLGGVVFIVYSILFGVGRKMLTQLHKLNFQRYLVKKEISELKQDLEIEIEEEKRIRAIELSDIDRMSGLDFEHYVSELLIYQGFQAEVTPGSNDFGVDIIAEKDGRRIAIQVKRYNSQSVSRVAVSDAVTGKDYYNCNEAMVITNSTFTKGAKTLAQGTKCQLVDRGVLSEWILKFQQEEIVPETDEILDLISEIACKRAELQKLEYKLEHPVYKVLSYFSATQWAILFSLGFLVSEILIFAYSNIYQFFQEVINAL